MSSHTTRLTLSSLTTTVSKRRYLMLPFVLLAIGVSWWDQVAH